MEIYMYMSAYADDYMKTTLSSSTWAEAKIQMSIDLQRARIEAQRKNTEIVNRYNNQDLSWGYHGRYRRRPFTSKQLKRMQKQTNKWRKRIFEEE